MCWFLNILKIGKIPTFGLYVQMAITVGSSFIKFGFTFFSLVLGFAYSFSIIFPSESAFANQGTIWAPIIKVLVMATGELEYNNLYYRPEESIELREVSRSNTTTDTSWQGDIKVRTQSLMFPVTGHLLLVAFVVMVSLIMMNLLVSIAISDVKEIHDLSHLLLMVQKIKTIHVMDSVLTNVHRILPSSVGRCIKRHHRGLKGKYCLDLKIRCKKSHGLSARALHYALFCSENYEDGCIYALDTYNAHKNRVVMNGKPIELMVKGAEENNDHEASGDHYFIPTELTATKLVNFVRFKYKYYIMHCRPVVQITFF